MPGRIRYYLHLIRKVFGEQNKLIYQLKEDKNKRQLIRVKNSYLWNIMQNI